MSFHILNQSEKLPGTVSPGRRRAVLAAVVAVALYGALTGLHQGNAHTWIAFSDLGELLAVGIAMIACAMRARRVTSWQTGAL